MNTMRNCCIKLCWLLGAMLAAASADSVAQKPPHERPPSVVTVGVGGGGLPPITIVNDGQLSGAAVDILKATLDPSAQVRVVTFPDQ